MTSISTNPTAMQAARSLAANAQALARTQARIESGQRIPSADADPAVFPIAQSMRADLSGWAAVRDTLGLGGAVVTTAADASRAISDALGTLKAKYLQWIGLPGGPDRATVRAEIEGIIGRVETMARQATTNGVNLLVIDAPPAPPDAQPPDFAAVIGQTSGSGSQTFALDGGAVAGRVVLDVDAFTALDIVEVWQGGVRVAATGRAAAAGGAAVDPGLAVNGLVTLSFDYDPANGRALELRFNPGGGGSGWAVNGLRLQDPVPPPPPPGPAFEILRHPSGRSITIGLRDMTPAGLGLDPLDFDDAEAGLRQVEAAVRRAADDAGHFGAGLRTVGQAKAAARAFADGLREGLGALVDADLGAEAARLTSLQARIALSTQSLGIANAAPGALLALFRR